MDRLPGKTLGVAWVMSTVTFEEIAIKFTGLHSIQLLSIFKDHPKDNIFKAYFHAKFLFILRILFYLPHHVSLPCSSSAKLTDW